MSRRTLNRFYHHFEGEERYRLINAAFARGDETEIDRLQATARESHLSVKDFGPFALAYQTLSLLSYIEVLDLSGQFTFAWAMADQEDAKRGDRWYELALLAGYHFRIRWRGWEAFCKEHHADAAVLWSTLGGYDRLLGHLRLAESLSEQDVPVAEASAKQSGTVRLTVDEVVRESTDLYEMQVRNFLG